MHDLEQIKDNIANKLFSLRKQNGLSQQGLSNELREAGIFLSVRQIGRIENKKHLASLDTIYYLSKFFNVPMEYFVEEDSEILKEYQLVKLLKEMLSEENFANLKTLLIKLNQIAKGRG